jgi:aminomethyltransferase
MAAIKHLDFTQVLEHSPFYERVEAASHVKSWSGWNGIQTARVYDTVAAEYFAARSSTSVLDLTPMEKYRITGPDANAFLNHLVIRDVSKLKPGRVSYVAWCNDEGKVIDDGTIFHLHEGEYRLCSAHHQFDWLLLSSEGYDVCIEEETFDVAALSVQGPTSYSVLSAAGITGLESLKPFGILHGKLNGFDVTVSRTGFTGDLGYELWCDPDNALALWDAIFAVKERGLYDIKPFGLEALAMVRIEAGFILPGDDFNTAETAIRAEHDRSPFELGLEWIIDFEKSYFTGKKALLSERDRPIKRRLVKLMVEGNKQPVDSFLYAGKKGKRIGTVKAHTWSPILKANLTLADIEYQKGIMPQDIWAEIYYSKELEWHSTWAKCQISEKPFWNPARKNITPPGPF